MLRLRSIFEIKEAIEKHDCLGILFHSGTSPASDEMLEVVQNMEEHLPAAKFALGLPHYMDYSREILAVERVPVFWIIRERCLFKIIRGVDAKAYLREAERAWVDEHPCELSEEAFMEGLNETVKKVLEEGRKFMSDKPLIIAHDTLNCPIDFPLARHVERENEPELLGAILRVAGFTGDALILNGGEKILKTHEDIISNEAECHEAGTLTDKNLENQCHELIKQAEYMVFLKGSKERPFCRYSRQLVNILNKSGLEYSAFDVFTDHYVREKMKDVSGWPTFPQIYVRGKLIGGLDVVLESQNEHPEMPLKKLFDELAKKTLDSMSLEN